MALGAATLGGGITFGSGGVGVLAGAACEAVALGCVQVVAVSITVVAAAGAAELAVCACTGGNKSAGEEKSIKSEIQKLKTKTPQQLIYEGWKDVTDSRMAARTNSRELYNPNTMMKIRYDKAVQGASGYEGVDHYHIYNSNYTNKKVDIYGNPVGKGTSASHIVIGK